MEGSLDPDWSAFFGRLEGVKRVNSNAMKAIRDLAMGLRPSMRDDLGLEPALEWQGREFSRHTGVPAVVKVSGALWELSEAQRTCICRVVQCRTRSPCECHECSCFGDGKCGPYLRSGKR